MKHELAHYYQYNNKIDVGENYRESENELLKYCISLKYTNYF